MNNSVGGNLTDAGAGVRGGHIQTAPAQFEEDTVQRITDGMAHSIVRLQRELDEANARIALLEEEQKILATARLDQSHFGRTVAKAAVTEGGTGYSGAERPEPSPHFYERRFREVHEANARIAGELVKAREEAKRATYDAAQETIKVSTVKSHWIEACRERDEAREEVARLRRQSKQWKLAAKDWRRFTFYMWRRYRAELAAKEAAK